MKFVADFLDAGLRHFVPDENKAPAAGPELVFRTSPIDCCCSSRKTPPARKIRISWANGKPSVVKPPISSPRLPGSTRLPSPLGALDRVSNRIVEELERQQSGQATRLQQQVTKTLQDQFDEVSSRMLDTEVAADRDTAPAPGGTGGRVAGRN